MLPADVSQQTSRLPFCWQRRFLPTSLRGTFCTPVPPPPPQVPISGLNWICTFWFSNIYPSWIQFTCHNGKSCVILMILQLLESSQTLVSYVKRECNEFERRGTSESSERDWWNSDERPISLVISDCSVAVGCCTYCRIHLYMHVCWYDHFLPFYWLLFHFLCPTQCSFGIVDPLFDRYLFRNTGLSTVISSMNKSSKHDIIIEPFIWPHNDRVRKRSERKKLYLIFNNSCWHFG